MSYHQNYAPMLLRITPYPFMIWNATFALDVIVCPPCANQNKFTWYHIHARTHKHQLAVTWPSCLWKTLADWCGTPPCDPHHLLLPHPYPSLKTSAFPVSHNNGRTTSWASCFSGWQGRNPPSGHTVLISSFISLSRPCRPLSGRCWEDAGKGLSPRLLTPGAGCAPRDAPFECAFIGWKQNSDSKFMSNVCLMCPSVGCCVEKFWYTGDMWGHVHVQKHSKRGDNIENRPVA